MQLLNELEKEFLLIEQQFGVVSLVKMAEKPPRVMRL